MELGTGLVVVAIIAIAAWQIDKRNAWGRALRAAIWALGLAIVGGFGLWGYFWNEGRLVGLAHSESVERLRRGKLGALESVALGMPLTEVEYLWGKATDNDGGSSRQWKTALHIKAVGMSDAGEVRLVFCAAPSGHTYSDCSPIAGLNMGSSEAAVLQSLGEPTLPATVRSGMKFLTYGKKGGYFDVVLKEGRVSAFALYAEQKGFEVSGGE